MAKVFRRAASKVKNSRDGHGSLGLLIFDEKVVYETFQKVVIAKADGEFSKLSIIKRNTGKKKELKADCLRKEGFSFAEG